MEDYGLISVIIPVYNSEKYLRQCIDSVLKQTYKNFEIILVNDGSVDSSGEMCDDYASQYKFIKVIHKPNGGASTARNKGIKAAEGKYIFFLDSDDWIVENALEKLVVAADKEKADLVFCEAKAIDDQSNAVLKDNYEYKHNYETGNAYQIMDDMMKNKEFHVAIWMLLIDKNIFDNNNLLFKEGIIYEDMIISYQFYCLAQRAAFVKEKLYVRRYRPDSVMTSKKTEKNFVSAAQVYREVSKFMDMLPEERKSTRHIIRCAFHVLNIYRQMPSEIKKKYKSEHNEIKKDILSKDAYNDKSLKFDCYSHLLWGIYKVFKKIF